jgi:hypothetical protein
MRVTAERAKAALGAVEAVIGRLAPIVSIGLTKIGDDFGLKVNLLHDPSDPAPPFVEGVPIRVEVTGRAVASRSS